MAINQWIGSVVAKGKNINRKCNRLQEKDKKSLSPSERPQPGGLASQIGAN